MTRLPGDLSADPENPTERLAMKAMQTMDIVRRQVDRILFLRSTGGPWGAAVEGLRDVLVGLEDQQFWDGMPLAVRKKVKELEADPSDKKSRKAAKELRAKYAVQGWDGVPVAWTPIEVRVLVPGTSETRLEVRQKLQPNAENLSDMFRIMLHLLHRHGLLWKTRLDSALPPVEDWEAGDG